jgi:hypothetical protein|nr:hypothetical protein [Gordonia sp. (in: high G+C Gram-positive bacteria)]
MGGLPIGLTAGDVPADLDELLADQMLGQRIDGQDAFQPRDVVLDIAVESGVTSTAPGW